MMKKLELKSSTFWSDFKRDCWRRKPAVLKNPFKIFPVDSRDIEKGVEVLIESLSTGSTKFRCVAQAGSETVVPLPVIQALFPERKGNFARAEVNFKKRFGKDIKEIGVLVNNFQSLTPELWRGTTDFLNDLYSHVGVPAGGALTDLFYGNYRSSFLGLHKDTQDIFAFITHGKKTMYLWPYEEIAPHLSELERESPHGAHHTKLNYKKFIKTAIRLDGEAGDILYWPSEYWHIAESDGVTFTSMLSLGLFARPEGVIHPRKAETLIFKSQVPEHFVSYSQDSLAMVKEFMSWENECQKMKGSLAARELMTLSRISAFGFPFGLHFSSLPLPHRRSVLTSQDSQAVGLSGTARIYDMVAADHSQLVASNGVVFKLSQDDGYRKFLDGLKGGDVKSVKEVISMFKTTRPKDHAWVYHADTFGNWRLLPMVFDSTQDEAKWVLSCLLFLGAVSFGGKKAAAA